MQAYDASRFDPPAPLALVTVKSEQLGITIQDVPMLLDTGADVSLLPRARASPSWYYRAPGNTNCNRSTEQRAQPPPSPPNCSFSANRFAGNSCSSMAGTAFSVGTF
jgi:hypothetical protein